MLSTLKIDISLILVVLIGCSLSIGAFLYVQRWEKELEHREHQEKLDSYVRNLSQAFDTFDNISLSIQGLYNVHDEISRENFQEFLRDKQFNRHAIQAVEWIPYVSAAQRTNFEQLASDKGLQDFYLWQLDDSDQPQPVEKREAYFPIYFSEPKEYINRQQLGYDIASHPTLKAALEKARENNSLTTSEAFKLFLKSSEQSKKSNAPLAIRIFLPIYQRSSDPHSRGKTLKGFVSNLVIVEDLMEKVLRIPKQRTPIFIRLYEVSKSQKHLLFTPLWYRYDAYNERKIKTLEQTELEFGNRTWLLELSQLKETSLLYRKPVYAWLVLIIGILFTFGVWRYLNLTLTRAHWAEELVNRRTQSLVEANNALEESQRRFQAVFDEAALGIAQTDLNGKILDSNRALQELLAYSEEELYGRHLFNLAHPDDKLIDAHLHQQMIENQYDSYIISKRYRSKHQETIWTNQSCSIVRDTAHPFIITMIEDVTERKCAEQARLEAEKKYRDIFENAVEGIFQCTPSGHYLSINPAFVKIFGYQSAEDMFSKLTDIGQQLYLHPERHAEFISLLQTRSEVQNFEYEARCADGHIIWVSENVRVVRDEDGQVRYYEGIVEDITERKRAEEKLRYDASHDLLTGLLNRAAFTDYLTQTLQSTTLAEEIDKNSPIPYAVLFVDLDRFKIVNDSMGHLAGDKLLTKIAARLKQQMSKEDMIARFGGDEFALMLKNISNLMCLEQRIEQIQKELSQPYTLEQETFNTSSSIGIALASPDYHSANEVLRDADTAMYEAKKQGRGRAVIFQPGMHTDVLNLLRMESDLRRALEREEFILYYQPIISLENHNTISLEALVRWQHPERGLVPPDKFIPVAEETGLIKELGLWVFKTACEQLKRWQQQFPHCASLGININVSPIQLKQPQLVEEIKEILQHTGVKGPCCRVEITESAIMQDPESILAMLNDLKSLEILLYIDDFGTGYTSLSYLKKFPVDALKIDKSFIREIHSPTDKSTQIAEAIIALGEAFDLKVVAEGVENDFQVSILQAARCHHVQGYLFSRPQNSQATTEYLSVVATNSHSYSTG